ncbi:MAG: formate dehydrogenase subunit gamma [Gammaproteobacteria bacterium]|nr:formate dehydrogenase subunit gamma [Gammaproteobacteria bacterium]
MSDHPAARSRASHPVSGPSLAAVLVCCVLLLWTGAALGQDRYERPPAAPPGSGDVATDYWRGLRQGQQGVTNSWDGARSDLINVSGQAWTTKRNEEVTKVGAWAFAIFTGAVVLFYLLRGTIRLEEGRSGKVVERWPMLHRVVHWWVAILFLVQLVTGLLLLYGKSLVIPLIGKEAFSSVAMLSKNLHNYLGPLLFVGMVVMLIAWLNKNLPTLTDLKWFAKGGGLIGKGHASSGFLNGGEKIWFWIVILMGGFVAVTGLVLDFPQFGQSRDTMQLMNYLHGIAGLVIGAMSLGHIYIGTIGTEGAFEGMKTGYVDANWAAQHHDLWYEEVKDQAVDAAEVGVETPKSSGEGGEARSHPA